MSVETARSPAISVIVPVRNEAENIAPLVAEIAVALGLAALFALAPGLLLREGVRMNAPALELITALYNAGSLAFDVED